MIELLKIPNLYIEWANSIAGANQFVAGAIVAGGFGVATYVLRSVPSGIYKAIIRRITLTLTVDNTHECYDPLLLELQKYAGDMGTRDFTVGYNYKRYNDFTSSFLAISGIGFHWFFHSKRPMWYTISDLDSAGVNSQKQRIVLGCLGFNKDVIDSFLRSLEKPKPPHSVFFYNSEGGDTNVFVGSMAPQRLDQVCLDSNVRTQIESILDTFVQDKEANRRLGIPDKLVILLHGEPGNGKSKLVPAIAAYLKKHVNNINTAGLLSANSLQQSISDTDKLHVLEDIHSVHAFASNRRQALKSPKKEKSDNAAIFDLSISLSEFLNVLNGSVPLQGQVIIMTTNYIDDLDPAILRPGRTDYVVKLPRIQPNTVNTWLEERIEGFCGSGGFTKSVRGCDIGGLLQRSKGDIDKIKDLIPTIEDKIPEEQYFTYADANSLNL